MELKLKISEMMLSSKSLFKLVFLKNSKKAFNLFTITSIKVISTTIVALNFIFIEYIADEFNDSIGYNVPLFGSALLFHLFN